MIEYISGDIQQTEIRSYEEGLWIIGAVWLWDCPDNIQFQQQTLPICQHGYGQSTPQVHRVQRTPRITDQQKHYRGNLVFTKTKN